MITPYEDCDGNNLMWNLYGMDGRLMRSLKSESCDPISINDLEEGLYIIELLTDDRRSVLKVRI